MEGNHIAVDRKMATNLVGCFACGDVVGTPYQYIKAAGEGNVAALSAVRYLGGNTNGKENF
jgi:thioredoxin reductase (NADPH)